MNYSKPEVRTLGVAQMVIEELGRCSPTLRRVFPCS